ncbi:Uma2 family endonuclease [Alienimonas chondri]|uniref:Putative restriction endonuclease domain-containing protein n=1 Tax=Alienimonas chondri TaxID=2681879 RepID=A0ABX1VIV1_9PLAN|nr:Uma2 family endonuclease [Alienimonas chondri]NNJ28016.1 hypothetical protein [Alienimonas chondri]
MPALAEPPPAVPARQPADRSSASSVAPGLTLADLSERFGPIPASRVVTAPAPGTATLEDWEAANRRGDGLYELIDGTLIRKPMSTLSSWLGAEFVRLLGNLVVPRGLGWIQQADGFFNFEDGLRAPDASFTRKDRLPDGRLPDRGYVAVTPALVVEVLSPGNTRREMALKRSVYFAAGVEAVWEADPLARTVVVWTGPDADTLLRESDTLTGEPVLPGFTAPLSELFAGADLSNPA